ncbi:Uncharacterized conserved protein [Janthinobacterium sp. Marseille]|nr:DUF1116 domain-containing protein [Janthinobacterium sp. Marseille]ABR91313.1 Uncharacterized conserved protein [Janthinobacterium sp. Marseille]
MNPNKFDEEIALIASRFDDIFWTDILLRSEALPALPASVMLHAGPPLTAVIPAAIRQATLEAILFEGLAEDHEAAAQLLAHGKVTLQPAQDHGVVTPLAQVVSASMPMFATTRHGTTRYAPMVESTPPALRFGKPGAGSRAQLQLLARFGLHVLKPILQARPVALSIPIQDALLGGEECHALTARANVALVAQLNALSLQDRQVILSNPGFVLPLLMAVCALRLEQSGHIVAAGGNGQVFGYRLRESNEWQTITATPPQGTRFSGHENTAALGAIGDSAVIDFCGLGAQALAFVPTLANAWKEFLPADLHAHRVQLLNEHSGMVDLKNILSRDCAPMVNLAILDKAAEAGLIGRGVFTVPPQLFADPQEQLKDVLIN